MIRTSTDFIEDMLAHGRSWIAILAVCRGVRSGRWYDECRTQLRDRGLMPLDDATCLQQRAEEANKTVVLEKARFTIGKRKN